MNKVPTDFTKEIKQFDRHAGKLIKVPVQVHSLLLNNKNYNEFTLIPTTQTIQNRRPYNKTALQEKRWRGTSDAKWSNKTKHPKANAYGYVELLNKEVTNQHLIEEPSNIIVHPGRSQGKLGPQTLNQFVGAAQHEHVSWGCNFWLNLATLHPEPRLRQW